MMRLSAFYTLLFASLLGVVAPAAAQDVSAGPELHAEDAGDFDDLSVDFDEAFNAIDNKYLSDSIRLHYQINLLEKMTQRQAELLKISDSFKSLGIPFTEPAPARGLCAQLPPNAPCMKHYPDIYQPVVGARKAYYDSLMAQRNAAAGVVTNADDPAAIEAARKEKEEAERKLAEAKAAAAKIERETRYQWSEVSCIAGNCSGVVIGTNMPGYRATVRKGMRLGDGTLVSDIHARGIIVVIDGDRIDLRPAPSGDASAQTAAGTNGLSQVIPATITMTPTMGATGAVAYGNSGVTGTPASASGPAASSGGAPGNTGGSATAAAASAQAASAGASDTGSTSTVEPALGPSGLF